MKILAAFALLAVVVLVVCTSAFTGPTVVSSSCCDPRIPIRKLPFTIQTPGSYYVAGNLTVSSSGVGITVATGNVTIDLNGFTLNGAGVPHPAVRSNGGEQIHILGGSLSGWGGGGVDLSASKNCRLSDLSVSGTGNGLAFHLGDHAAVVRCAVDAFNAGQVAGGIRTGLNSVVSDCRALENAGVIGIQVGNASQVLRSIVRGGIKGIVAGDSSLVHECVSADNGTGIQAGVGSHVSDCVITNAGSTLENASIVISRGIVNRCTIQNGNFLLNANEAQIVDSVFVSAGNNLHLNSYCTFSRNTVMDSILSVDGTHNQVEGNHFYSTPAIPVPARIYIGTIPESVWNFFVRNAVATNMTVTIQGNNHSGAFIQSPPVGFTSDQPWANFKAGQ